LFSGSQSFSKASEAGLLRGGSDATEKPFQADVVSQIVEKAALKLSAGQGEVRIDLKPEFLGHLRMNISTEEHQVIVRILTEMPAAKMIIENNINQLRTALQSHGLEIDTFDVLVAGDSDQSDRRYEGPSFLRMEEDFDGKGENDTADENCEETVQTVNGDSSAGLIDFFA
jgi:flagellar hook-length control protein FliK